MPTPIPLPLPSCPPRCWRQPPLAPTSTPPSAAASPQCWPPPCAAGEAPLGLHVQWALLSSCSFFVLLWPQCPASAPSPRCRRYVVQVCPSAVLILREGQLQATLPLLSTPAAPSTATDDGVAGTSAPRPPTSGQAELGRAGEEHGTSAIVQVTEAAAADPFILLRLSDGTFQLLGPAPLPETNAEAVQADAAADASASKLVLCPVAFPLLASDAVTCFSLFRVPMASCPPVTSVPHPSPPVFCAVARASGAVQILQVVVPDMMLLFSTNGVLPGRPLLRLETKRPSAPSSSSATAASPASSVAGVAVVFYPPSRRLHLFALLADGQVSERAQRVSACGGPGLLRNLAEWR